MRYIITIADDDRRPLDKLCQKLTAADSSPRETRRIAANIARLPDLLGKK